MFKTDKNVNMKGEAKTPPCGHKRGLGFIEIFDISEIVYFVRKAGVDFM